MERNQIAITVITAAALIGMVPFAISETSVNSQKTTFEPSANVTLVTNTSGNVSLGLAPGKKGLEFGDLPLQSTKRARKTIDLNSSQATFVAVKSSGNISQFLKYEKKHYFEGDRQIKIEFETEEPGYYEGTLELKILTPKNEIGRKWIELRSSLPF